MDYRSYPYETAYVSRHGLILPLAHLLGNKIAISLDDPLDMTTGRSLVVSAWKFKTPGPYAGRIHMAPRGFEEITLIEDMSEMMKRPKDFPNIFERTTKKDLVYIGMFYPKTREIWNYQIHMDYTNLIEDEECTLVREGSLKSLGTLTDWGVEEDTIRDPVGFNK